MVKPLSDNPIRRRQACTAAVPSIATRIWEACLPSLVSVKVALDLSAGHRSLLQPVGNVGDVPHITCAQRTALGFVLFLMYPSNCRVTQLLKSDETERAAFHEVN